MRPICDLLRRLTLSVWIGISFGAAAAEPIRIAPLPMENREATVKAFNPVVTYMAQQLGQPVELVYFDKNSEIVSALQNHTLDIGMLGPLPYVTLRLQTSDVEPLVLFKEANGEARYRCTLVSFSGEGPKIRQLRNKRIALTQPLSTCGYLGTNAILRQHAGITLEDTQYRYLNTHEAAALSVVSGEADAAGIKEEFAIKFSPLGITSLAFSESVPALGLFASKVRLDAKRIEEIRRILLSTPPSVYQNWGNAMKFGMVPAEDVDFETVRRLGDPASIPKPPKGQ